MKWTDTLLILPIFCYHFAYNQCDTPTPDYANLMTEGEVNTLISQRKTSSTYAINITFHIIRKSDGTDGATASEINDELVRINAFFAPSDIQFNLESINEIWNDAYAASDADWFNITKDILYPTHGATSRIDAFIFNSAVNGVNGNAFNIPSDYFAASENRLNTGNWPHEIGHDLGLLHTHERYGQSCPSPLIENVNGSNCTTAGDRCCDTPADPNLDNATWSLATCTYTDGVTVDCNGATYAPNVRNLMSYGWTCRDHFTTCQMNRMQAELMSGDVGTNLSATFLAKIEGDAEVDGSLEVNYPASSAGDVPLIIDATNSSWYSGFKTSYGTNTTYVFGIASANGGIEVVNQNFSYAPVVASGFIIPGAADSGPSPSSFTTEEIDPLLILNKLGRMDFSMEIPISTANIPTILLASGLSSGGGINDGQGISLHKWLMISTLGLQQVERKNISHTQLQEKISSLAAKNRKINLKIQEATQRLEAIEKTSSIKSH